MKRLLLGAMLMTAAVAQAQQKNEEFTIAVLPDTQYYTEQKKSNNSFFISQTKWIVDNYKKENIVYVVHLGDIVNRGDEQPEAWDRAAQAMYILAYIIHTIGYNANSIRSILHISSFTI